MKTSPETWVRPRILFSQTPHSISRRAKKVPSRAAAELLRHLCEKTIGFGRGYIDLSYRALAEDLEFSWRTISRAARFLREMGDVATETLQDRSYRWYVLLEPEDIVADPSCAFRLKETPRVPESAEGHVTGDMGVMSSVSGGHVTSVMGVMSPVSGPGLLDEGVRNPVMASSKAPFLEAENGSLNIDLKDTCTNIHHQRGSGSGQPVAVIEAETDVVESFGHKFLLQKLYDVGVKQRIARKVMRSYEPQMVSKALESLSALSDVYNPAGFIIAQLQDGGYDVTSRAKGSSGPKTSSKRGPLSDAPMTSPNATQTRAEMDRIEADKERSETAYQAGMKVLLGRYKELSDDLKQKLKACWTRHLERIVPNTSKRAEILKSQQFQKIAFKETTERFFELIDQGLSQDSALAQMAA